MVNATHTEDDMNESISREQASRLMRDEQQVEFIMGWGSMRDRKVDGIVCGFGLGYLDDHDRNRVYDFTVRTRGENQIQVAVADVLNLAVCVACDAVVDEDEIIVHETRKSDGQRYDDEVGCSRCIPEQMDADTIGDILYHEARDEGRI